jgi:hypothetical protein
MRAKRVVGSSRCGPEARLRAEVLVLIAFERHEVREGEDGMIAHAELACGPPAGQPLIVGTGATDPADLAFE